MKKKLMDDAGLFLLRKGYIVKALTRSCFDLLARKGENIILMRVLEDANSVEKEEIEEMQGIASCIKASPIIIASKASFPLEDNVVYSRFGAFVLNMATFMACIGSNLPVLKSTKAGLAASVDSGALREKREEAGISMSSLSKKLGVSPGMVAKYENEGADMTIDRAEKAYSMFGKEIFRKIDVFHEVNINSEPKSEFSFKYVDLGFSAADINKAPFDIISKKDDEIILTKVGDKANPQLQSLSELLEADNLVIFRKKKPKDIPAITKKEFLEFEKSQELIKFLKGF